MSRQKHSILAIEPVTAYHPFLDAFSREKKIPITYASSFTEGRAAVDNGPYRLAVTELVTAPMGKNPGNLGDFMETLRLAHETHVPAIAWTNMPYREAERMVKNAGLDALVRKGPASFTRDIQVLHKLMQQLLEHPTDYQHRPRIDYYRSYCRI